MPSEFRQLSRRFGLALGFAWLNVLQKRKRVGLAVIGVAIGIAAVASMLLFGYSIEARVRQSLDSLGAEVLLVRFGSRPVQVKDGELLPEPGAQPPADALEQAVALLGSMPEVDQVARLAAGETCPVSEDGNDERQYQRADAGLARVLSLELVEGRFLTPSDADQPTVVLGAKALAKLRQRMPQTSLGSVALLCGRALTIVGILAPYKGKDAMPALEIDNIVLGALPSLRPGADALHRATVLVRMRGQAPANELIAARLGAVLGAQPDVAGAQQLNQVRREQATIYTQMLAILGGISLFVGSLGIANVMLVAVSERRAELGVRKALGATRADILMQFVAESSIICLLGALLGLLIGGAATAVVLRLGGLPLAISPAILAFSCITALACGVLAGIYPAKMAADTDVIESLRRAD